MLTLPTTRTLSAIVATAALALAGNIDSAFGGDGLVIDERFSSHWSSPERDGEGWMLEILDETTALAYWFTYDENGNQRWLHAVGQIGEGEIDFPALVLTTGGRFGPGFDPDDVVRENVGRARMMFADCNTGSLDYEAFGQQQTFAIQRLTSVLSLECETTGPSPHLDGREGQSGSWFDPSHSGEGYTLQWLPNGQALLIWFSFDTQGDPYWMLGIGQSSQGMVVFPDVHATRGARFGAAFDPDDVERFLWGELRLELACQTGSAHYHATIPEFGHGTLDLIRLTTLRGLDCVDPTPLPDWTTAMWTLRDTGAPALSELPAAAHGDHIYFAGGLRTLTTNTREFWRFAPATGDWTRLPDMPAPRDHAMMAAFDDSIYVFGGFATGPVQRDATSTVWRYDLTDDTWHSMTGMPFTRGAGGAAVIGESIYLAGGRGGPIHRYDPAQDAWTSLSFQDTAPRDHAAVVAYRGELWVLGGRDMASGIAHNAVTVFDPVTGTSRTAPAMFSPRSGFAAAVVGGQILVAGGESLLPAAPGYLVESVEVYSPDNQSWRPVTDLPIAVHGGPGVPFDGDFYVVLGSQLAGGINNPAHVQVLSLP